MLPRKKRLNRADFRGILGKNCYNSVNFTICARVKKSAILRFSCVVSKKVSNSAVIRNKLRRRVYSTIEEVYREIKPRDIVVVVKKGANKKSPSEFKRSLKKSLASAGLLV